MINRNFAYIGVVVLLIIARIVEVNPEIIRIFAFVFGTGSTIFELIVWICRKNKKK